MTNPLAILFVIFLMAFLVESLTEYLFGQAFEHVPKLAPFSWMLMYIAAAVGVVGAFVYGFDIISLVGIYIGQILPVTWFGILLTGLAIGRGSNFIHDLVVKFFVKDAQP
jgi:hypothetical protein